MSIPLMEIELKVLEALREDFKRNQWCEKMKANVWWSDDHKKWVASFRVDRDMPGTIVCMDPDRNEAIDQAREVTKPPTRLEVVK
jgi:hypothetical protein